MATTDRSRQLYKNVRTLFGDPTGRCRVCNDRVEDGRMKYCSPKCRQVAYAVLDLYQWSTVRERVLARDGYCCVNCGAESDLEVDHIEPLSDGGAALDERNLQTLCVNCHEEKGLDAVDHRDERAVDARSLLSARLEETDDQDAPPAVDVLQEETFVDAEEFDAPDLVPPEPSAPEDLANYLVDGIDRQDPEALREMIAYAEDRLTHLTALRQREISDEDVQETIDEDEEIEAADVDVDELEIDTPSWAKVYRKYLTCGKDCNGCPHGPYNYLYYRQANGDLTSKYLGRA